MTFGRVGRGVYQSSVAWSMAVIGLRVLGFLLVIGTALRLMPRESIGLWYGMVSLTLVAGCVEFGFSGTIARVTGYYWAGAVSVPDLGLSGVSTSTAGPNVGALLGVVAEARRVYRVLSVLYLVVASAMGVVWWLLLPASQRATPELLVALALLIVGGAFNLSAMFWPSVLQGLQRVRDSNVYMAAGFLAGYATALVGLYAGGGLVALASGLTAQSLVMRWLAWRHVARWFRSQEPAAAQPVEWRRLWPMTWRAGLAQAASYLVLPVMPVLVTTFSLSEGASFGLSVQAALLLHTLASSWIAVKWPLFGSLRAGMRMEEVRRIARTRLTLSVATFVGCAVVLPFVAPATLAFVGSRTPFVSTLVWALLALAAGCDLIVSAHAGLIQTGNQVTYLRAFVVTGVVNVVVGGWLALSYGAVGVLTCAIVSQLLLNVWWVPQMAWRQLAWAGGDRAN